jgi:FkbM family methyltransferase
MTMLRKSIKKLVYGSVPGFRGRFPYYGAQVYFPPNSFAFAGACECGVYERENTKLLRFLAKPGTWMFDVGANIGLMALPVLHDNREVKVLSFEPSPNTAPFLRRTVEGSRYKDRWQLVTKAVGRAVGTTQFHVSPASFDLFDGVAQTGRIRGSEVVELEMTTLDAEWNALGCPAVSVIKIDVEGWESEVLAGAGELVAAQQPSILLEWNAANLAACGVAKGSLLQMAGEMGYRLFNLPDFAEIKDATVLELQMLRGENFLLFPC